MLNIWLTCEHFPCVVGITVTSAHVHVMLFKRECSPPSPTKKSIYMSLSSFVWLINI